MFSILTRLTGRIQDWHNQSDNLIFYGQSYSCGRTKRNNVYKQKKKQNNQKPGIIKVIFIFSTYMNFITYIQYLIYLKSVNMFWSKYLKFANVSKIFKLFSGYKVVFAVILMSICLLVLNITWVLTLSSCIIWEWNKCIQDISHNVGLGEC